MASPLWTDGLDPYDSLFVRRVPRLTDPAFLFTDDLALYYESLLAYIDFFAVISQPKTDRYVSGNDVLLSPMHPQICTA